MKITNGILIPGVGLGEYKIGMDKKSALALLGSEYSTSNEETGYCIVSIDNAKLWFDSKEELIQIGVTHGFSTKYDGKVGIGDTLADVQEKIGEYYQEFDDYLIKGKEGIAFLLVDDYGGDTEWDELAAPIEWIFIYKC